MSKTVADSGSACGSDRDKTIFQAGALDLRALGLLEDGGAPDITGVLGRLLAADDGKGKTWAQRLAEVWIDDALKGNPRATVDILDRITKGRPARASDPAILPPISEEKALKILEALGGSGADATGARGDRARPESPAKEPAGTRAKVVRIPRRQGA